MSRSSGFHRQRAVRKSWRACVDQLAPSRPALHRYCLGLTGNVWDGEDLVQDTLLRVFGQLGKSDTRLENPKAYLMRTATNLWIDQVRRSQRAEAMAEVVSGEGLGPDETPDTEGATAALFQGLHPQERAAIVLKEVLDLSLEESAAMLGTTVGAVKSALSRARGRLTGRRPRAGFSVPPRDLVERFARALADRDIPAITALCAEHVKGELVGGAEFQSLDELGKVVSYAHFIMPRLGFGTGPRWKVVDYEGEAIVLGSRTLDGIDGINEIHRIVAAEGRIARLRIYCFCPETLKQVGRDLGMTVLPRPYRSPSLWDVAKTLIGFTPRWRRRA